MRALLLILKSGPFKVLLEVWAFYQGLSDLQTPELQFYPSALIRLFKTQIRFLTFGHYFLLCLFILPFLQPNKYLEGKSTTIYLPSLQDLGYSNYSIFKHFFLFFPTFLIISDKSCGNLALQQATPPIPRQEVLQAFSMRGVYQVYCCIPSDFYNPQYMNTLRNFSMNKNMQEKQKQVHFKGIFLA